MTTPIETVVRVAATPAQAKIFVAMLQAEGIPARTDGDSLVDEFAASRRLMNLLGTKVFVPTASLARAQEILAPVAVDPAELEREAMATPGETVARRAPRSIADLADAQRQSSLAGPLLALALGAAVLFAFLWQRADARAVSPHPLFDYVVDGATMREVRRSDGRTLRVLYDRDRDGVHERVDALAADGTVLTSAGGFADGIYASWTETRGDGLTVSWVDADRDGVQDRATVTDRAGKVLQTIEWQPGRGYVITTP
jgi:hypothetical protein